VVQHHSQCSIETNQQHEVSYSMKYHANHKFPTLKKTNAEVLHKLN